MVTPLFPIKRVNNTVAKEGEEEYWQYYYQLELLIIIRHSFHSSLKHVQPFIAIGSKIFQPNFIYAGKGCLCCREKGRQTNEK